MKFWLNVVTHQGFLSYLFLVLYDKEQKNGCESKSVRVVNPKYRGSVFQGNGQLQNRTIC